MPGSDRELQAHAAGAEVGEVDVSLRSLLAEDDPGGRSPVVDPGGDQVVEAVAVDVARRADPGQVAERRAGAVDDPEPLRTQRVGMDHARRPAEHDVGEVRVLVAEVRLAGRRRDPRGERPVLDGDRDVVEPVAVDVPGRLDVMHR